MVFVYVCVEAKPRQQISANEGAKPKEGAIELKREGATQQLL